MTSSILLGASAANPQEEVRADFLSSPEVSYDANMDMYMMTKDTSTDDLKIGLSRKFASIEPSILISSLNSVGYYPDKYAFNGDEFRQINYIAQLCDYFISQSNYIIVPDGTPVGDVPMLVATWEANNTKYDFNCLTNRELSHSYQNALACFQKQTGNCATYTAAFNSIVHSIPLNPETGLVDYNYENPVHYTVAEVTNNPIDHAWSAISLDGVTWSFWDITFYDANPRRTVYLNNPHADFGGVDNNHQNPTM